MELSILGMVPPNNHCDIENFLRANGCENLVHRGGDRGAADHPVERPGSHLSWCADNRCETSPPFCGSLLGATTGLFVLIFNVFVIFQRSSDFMISVTYFALVNLAMSKVDVHQDQGDQYEDGQGQVRIVMLYFNVLSQRLFK